jgi:hypothetical protein
VGKSDLEESAVSAFKVEDGGSELFQKALITVRYDNREDYKPKMCSVCWPFHLPSSQNESLP